MSSHRDINSMLSTYKHNCHVNCQLSHRDINSLLSTYKHNCHVNCQLSHRDINSLLSTYKHNCHVNCQLSHRDINSLLSTYKHNCHVNCHLSTVKSSKHQPWDFRRRCRAWRWGKSWLRHWSKPELQSWETTRKQERFIKKLNKFCREDLN